MNNRILGIIGSALLIIGIFLPIISFMGILTFSFWTFIAGSLPGEDPTGMVTIFRIIGIVILLLGIVSLVLTLKNNYKPLLGTGIVALGILVFVFIKLQSLFSQASEAASGGGDMGRQMAGGVGMGWGFYVLVLGAIALIVAAVMKSTVPGRTGDWTGSAPPPPPPPYNPGR